MNKTAKHLRSRLSANGPGLTVAIIALIVALSGGAFAASQHGSATASKSKKGPRGPKGPKGATGATGPIGPQGAQGAPGSKGDKGDTGMAGTSVVASSEPIATPNCEGRGGSKFVTGATTTYACNGKQGVQGEPGENGSPWTVGGTLPAGEKETGTWAFTATTADTGGVSVPLSFPIPLGSALEGHVHFETEENFTDSCKGSTEGPLPNAGELCVYLNSSEGEFEEIKTLFSGIFSASFPEKGASPQGAILKFSAPSQAVSYSGTFAVRAPAAP